MNIKKAIDTTVKLTIIKDIVIKEIKRLGDTHDDYLVGKRHAYQEMLEMLKGNLTGNINYNKVIGRG